jgi:hypothetical protein
MINFPGRSSVTLSTDANCELANALFEAARLMGAEALAYADGVALSAEAHVHTAEKAEGGKA